MAWPAKYFTFDGSVNQLANAADRYLKGALSQSDDSAVPLGFRGMDYYFSYWFKNIGGGLMVNEVQSENGSPVLQVIAYAVPGGLGMVFGSGKATDLVNGLATIPGATSGTFPGGPSAGDLVFV